MEKLHFIYQHFSIFTSVFALFFSSLPAQSIAQKPTTKLVFSAPIFATEQKNPFFLIKKPADNSKTTNQIILQQEAGQQNLTPTPKPTRYTSATQSKITNPAKSFNKRQNARPQLSKPTSSQNSITIAGKTIPIISSNNTLFDSGDNVAIFGNKFLYGHNSNHVFGSLKYLKPNQNFTTTINAKTTHYQIEKIILLPKTEAKKFMPAITRSSYLGKNYDLSLMTCSGQTLPNRDATHRLILFARAI